MRKEVDKLKFLELIFLFSGSFALLWYSIVKAYIEFPIKIFLIFLVGLTLSAILVSYLLKRLLTSYLPDI